MDDLSQAHKVPRRAPEQCLGLLIWATSISKHLRPWLAPLYSGNRTTRTTHGLWIPAQAKVIECSGRPIRCKADLPVAPASHKPTWIRLLDPDLAPTVSRMMAYTCAAQSGGRHPVSVIITLKSGVGTVVETGSDDGHFMAVRGPITLRHLRFRLTDRPTKGLVLVVCAVLGSRLIPRKSFKIIFPIKPDEASATGAKNNKAGPRAARTSKKTIPDLPADPAYYYGSRG